MADGEYTHVSSSLIKQVARFGGDGGAEPVRPARLVEPIMGRMKTFIPG